jgi:hypothetical protein
VRSFSISRESSKLKKRSYKQVLRCYDLTTNIRNLLRLQYPDKRRDIGLYNFLGFLKRLPYFLMISMQKNKARIKVRGR